MVRCLLSVREVDIKTVRERKERENERGWEREGSKDKLICIYIPTSDRR